MKLMVVGGGGREHAIIKALKKNPSVTEIYALPGNGGIARDAVCVPIGAKDLDGIVRFAQEQHIDFAGRQGGYPGGQQSFLQAAYEEIRHPHRRL